MKLAKLFFLFLFAIFSEESIQIDETTSVELCTNGTEDSCEAYNSSDIPTSSAVVEITDETTKLTPTTKKPKTTLTKSVNKKVTVNPNATTSVKPHPDCSCDTTRGGCEINCCCDVDCSVEQQAVFTHCIRIPQVVDSDHCFPQQLLYHNNTDYQTVDTDPGVMCVLHHNTLSSTDYLDVPVIRTLTTLQLKLDKYKYYSWQNPQASNPVFHADFYENGSPIWINDNTTITHLELPSSLGHTSLCQSSVIPKYLENIETSCAQQIRTKSDCLGFKELRSTVIASPQYFNFTLPQECTEDVCLSIQQFFCNGTCSEKTIPHPIFNESSNTCHNIINSLEYKIYHNGSQGIVEVKQYYRLRNISLHNSSLYRKRYSVTYIWAGITAQPVLKRSGRPGYEIGKPIISGRRTDKGIVYNSTESDWISIGVAGRSGYCEKRYNLLFGENVRTQCSIVVTGTCAKMQQQIWQQLLGPAANLSEVVVSSYGDPRGKDKDAWVPLLSADLPPPPTLTTVVDIVIIHSLVGHVSSPQTKIIAAYLNILPSAVNCKTNKTVVTVETSVKFIDKTTPAITKFAQPPVYEIKLPRDFFYPFLSSASINKDLKGVQYLLPVVIGLYLPFTYNFV